MLLRSDFGVDLVTCMVVLFLSCSYLGQNLRVCRLQIGEARTWTKRNSENL